LTVLDSSDNIVNSDTITMTHFNPNGISSLPDGSLLTGGCFLSNVKYAPPGREYSSFIIKLNSEGNGVIDSTDFFWSGDADNDGYLTFSDDAVVIAAAFGKS